MTMRANLNSLTAEQQQAWTEYHNKYNLADYGYSTQMMAYWDFLKEQVLTD